MRKRLKISRRDLQLIGAFALVATVVTSIGAYAYLYPPASDHFFGMWILGAKGTAEHYYPNDNPVLNVGEPLNWTLGVANHMGSLEYVVVRVKLLNSTIPSPNATTGTPSLGYAILELRHVLADNETWSFPFTWEILSVAPTGESLAITRMTILGTPYAGTLVSAVSGGNFRFVFELWFYDQTANDLTFTWQGMGSQHAVWTQIWFNATATQGTT